MFIDLLSEEIQPEFIPVKFVPEIKISEGLRKRIDEMLKDDDKFARVSEQTSVVQTDRDKYAFFSNQWYYYAVACRKYAEALYDYCEFFVNRIKGDSHLVECVYTGNTNDPQFSALFSSDEDKSRMMNFIKGDSDFRPGKNMVNGVNKIRSASDVLGSCVLKKLPMPDASSGYLGTLIYNLVKNKDIYDVLESEINEQVNIYKNIIKLSSVGKNCAKEIIDYIYDLDQFDRISSLFVNNTNIKINTEGILEAGNLLRYVFAKQDSDMYTPGADSKARVFTDKEYDINIDGTVVKTRLTTEWTNSGTHQDGGANYLDALIAVVNKCYRDCLTIKEEDDGMFLYPIGGKFTFDDVPNAFTDDFSRRYIKSLLAKPFVILTGNSGTGKTRISKMFAEYLETVTDGKKNWLIVPVGADWTDNTKILGFYNPIANNGAGEYVKTGIVDLIERANINRETPYFLILDEMNLSHVERYFSDFLSHMETPDNPFSMDGYGGDLEFPDNLFVVGTVNIDETTYMFSPKVLDRANVIEFKPAKEAVFATLRDGDSSNVKVTAQGGVGEAFLRTALEIRSGHSELSDDDYAKLEEVFGKVWDLLDKCGFEFAFRTVREIKQYAAAAHEIDNGFNIVEIIDEQMLQKVLPKVHGNKKEIGGLLDELISICDAERLERSKAKLELMKGKLVNTQYTSFI